jgi:transcription elongation GreA/GreB family factor
MSFLTIPNVSIGREDYIRLKKVAETARRKRHPAAPFLLSEIRRARVLDNAPPDAVVGLGRQVSYRVNFGPTVRRRLALPENFRDSDRDVSILSQLGAALIGLKARDRMPYRDIFGALHFVTVIDVEQFARVEITGGPPNPGPQAA